MKKTLICALLILCAALSPAVSLAAEDPVRTDAYLEGYIASVLERKLGWGRERFSVKVDGGQAAVTIYGGDPQSQVQVRDNLKRIKGLSGLTIIVADRKSRGPAGDEAGGKSFGGVTGRVVALPATDLFQTPLADPKQPSFFVSYRVFHTPLMNINSAAVGYGENFGLVRFAGRDSGDGLQFNLNAGLLAQFNLDAPSADLINADYIIGFPVTYRWGPVSGRLRVYHQSSHLGDEFLLNTNTRRVNLSYESADLLLAYEWNNFRAYAGGEYLFHRDPDELRPNVLHSGLDYRGVKSFLLGGRLIGGMDFKNFEEHHWSENMAGKLGLEFGYAGGRRIQVVAEAFKGFSPYGQFYDLRISYYGLGVYLGF